MGNAVNSNYAFISYSHKDAKIARWLQQRLEQYSIPPRIYPLVNRDKLPENGSHYLRPVFLDQTDLTAGLLVESLQANLESAKYLIVICSPHSAKSDWVDQEVAYFLEQGEDIEERLKMIIPFVVDGVPYLDLQIAAGKNPEGEECMPPTLVRHAKLQKNYELLGVDIRGNSIENAALRVVSKMLDVNFDIIWNRHARLKRMRFATIIMCIILFFVVTGYFFMPMRLSYSVQYPDDGNLLLLPEDAELTIEGITYFLGSDLDTTIRLKNRPGYYRGRKLPVEFHATFFDTIRTEFVLGYGFTKNEVLYIHRDATFADFSGRVLDQDGIPVEGAKVSIMQEESRTDEDGHFFISIPESQQAETQAIIIERAGYYDIYRPDECPSNDLMYIMYRRD